MPGGLDRELLDYMVEIYHRCVLVGPGGRIGRSLYVRQNGRRVLRPQAGPIGTSAAYLALTPVEGNPFFGRDDLLRLAVEAGDRLVLDHLDVGRAFDRPNHFDIYPLVRIVQLAGDHAGRTRLARWRETIARNLRAIMDLIDRAWPNLGRPAPWSGTGPNHYFGWFSVGREQATLLGDGAAVRRIDRAFLKHLRIQSPEGYFPEHVGPSVGYQHVSLGGVAEYHRQHPRQVTMQAIERGVAFMVRAIYPDGRGLETLDERNRLGSYPRLQPGLAWTGEGRTLLARNIEAQRERFRRTGPPTHFRNERDAWTLGSAFRCYEHLQATRSLGIKLKPLPVDRKRFTWRIEDKSLVRKDGPWFYALSAWTHNTHAGNPYHFERTQALSVYHDAGGLIIGGGNDKRNYHNATIHLVEGGEVHYFPALRGRMLAGVEAKALSTRGKCDRLMFDYGSANAVLEVRCESDERLRIALAVETTMTDPDIAMVLQLPVQPPIALRSGARQIRLGRARHNQRPKTTPIGRSLALPGTWKLVLPAGASLAWPHVPWNGYRPPDYKALPADAVALVRVPLSKHSGRAEVVVLCGRLASRP